jgi:hypothetical protein
MGGDEGFLGQLGPAFLELLPRLDERSRRLALGMAAVAAGEGGTGRVAVLTGASWQTVAAGRAELESGDGAPPGRVRRPGGGRKRLEEADPGLPAALESLVRDAMRGDPQSPLLWTTRSLGRLSGELTGLGHPCSPGGLRLVMRRAGYTMQSNSRAQEGRQHPERDAQFRYIAGQARAHLDAGQPVISVDAKKKEQVGNYRQAGREWGPAGEPAVVRSHDFPEPGGGAHAIPFGVYDEAANAGLVNVGTDGNTAALAVESVRRWHDLAGRHAYPAATALLVTCDAGGSNGYRNRAWKSGLAELAQATGLDITVCHFPPGTSKWNKIEHRLFCHISLAWRARPLTSYDVIISTIGAITTRTGLAATAVLDEGRYPAGARVGDEQMRDIEERCLARHDFRGEWNYTLLAIPRPAPAPATQPAARPRWPRHALAHPALTGMAPASSAALAAAIQVPAAARREHDLYARRGGPRRASGSGRRPRASLHDLVLATLITRHLRIPQKELAPAFGISPDIMFRGTRLIRALLPGVPHPPPAPPPGSPPRTLTELTAYATRHGITGIPGQPPAAATAPEATLTTPTHRKLN